MLIDPDMFKIAEDALEKNGKIEEFEKKSGKILGRAMITLGYIPENLKEDILKDRSDEDLYIFNCSFDFYDAFLGLTLDKETMDPASGVWVTEQEEGADHPNEVWTRFFIDIIVDHVLESDGDFGIPIYIFINDTSEMVLVPTI